MGDGQVGRAPRGGDDRGDADTVVGRPRDLEPGYTADVGPHRRDGVDVADGVLRQSPAPALHVASTTRVSGRPSASATSATDTATRSSSSRWSTDSSRARPTDARRCTTSSDSAPVHAHLFALKVLALMVRPSTGGTRNPGPGQLPQAGTLHGKRHHGGRRGLDPGQHGRGGRRVRREQASGRCGRTHTHGIRLEHLRVGRRTEHQPPAGCRALETAHHRTGAHRGPAGPQLVGDEGGQPTDPAAEPGERWPRRVTGARGRARARRAGCRRVGARGQQASPWVARSQSTGIVARSDRRAACPAYTPPSRGSTRRSTTARPRRAAT